MFQNFLKSSLYQASPHDHTVMQSLNQNPPPPTQALTTYPPTNGRGLVNVHLTLSGAYELAITKSIWVPLIGRRLAWWDAYGDPLIFQPDGALIYSIDHPGALPGTLPPISACSVPPPFPIAPFITCLRRPSTRTCLPSTQTWYTRCKSGEGQSVGGGDWCTIMDCSSSTRLNGKSDACAGGRESSGSPKSLLEWVVPVEVKSTTHRHELIRLSPRAQRRATIF